MVAAAGAAASPAGAQPVNIANKPARSQTALNRQKLVGYMLAHEQCTAPELVGLGASAAQAAFGLLATSDHFQPWQANEGHAGEAWVTLGAVGERAQPAWIGTTVTCPTLGLLYPGGVFLGVGSGEALNERAATGAWPPWAERWERLIEAVAVIRALWAGEPVAHHGKYYTVGGKLYDPPLQPIPFLPLQLAASRCVSPGNMAAGW